MKKRYFCMALAFECAACIGAYLLQYFTARKMGMLRWVNHLCNTWTRSMDLDRINVIAMILVCVLALVLLLWTVKRFRSFAPMMAISACSIGVYLVCTICNTRRTMAAYYLVSFTLLLGSVIVLGIWLYALLKSE